MIAPEPIGRFARWGLRVAAVATALTALTLTPTTAHAQATLVTGLGGASGFGPSGQCLPRNDDDYSNAISITSVFPSGLTFFGTSYNQMWVNTNGSISFHSGISTFTPSAFPGAPQPMIAPFWADVDTRRSSSDATAGFDPSRVGAACPNDTDDEVWWDLDATGGRVIVTWNQVGYYSIHRDHRMSFQLILSRPTSCGGMGGVGNFDVEFRFNRCEWETGDASGGSGGFGGTPAQSGFDSGMAMYMGAAAYVSLPHSRMNGVAAYLCANSNTTPAQPGVWDFTVRGGTVMCPNAGTPCTVTGQQGVCAAGLTNCVGSGTACEQVTHPSAETCNGLDDDCNGMVDDGMGLCPASQLCVRGVCVGRCVEGSCFSGFTCDSTSGVCVETACMGMTCPAGQVCRGGACRGPCDGITCPVGEVCRSGYCVDPCNGITCTGGDVCENGICVPPCGGCRACGTGQACNTTSGVCVESGCATVTCPTGQACMGGHCVDPCSGAVCPTGQMCMAGNCVDGPMTGTDAGIVDDSSVPLDDVVAPPHGDSGIGGDDVATRTDARVTHDGGTGSGGNLGCGCRTTGSTGRSSGVLASSLAALALAAAGARRRRRR